MINTILTDDNTHNLELFTELLEKDNDTLINEALQEYFINQQKKLLEKKIEKENALTNLSYDEFWGDVEL